MASCGPAMYATYGAGIIGKHLPIGPMKVHISSQFRTNLASVAKFCDTGREVKFSKNTAEIINRETKEVEYVGNRSNNSYQLLMFKVNHI